MLQSMTHWKERREGEKNLERFLDFWLHLRAHVSDTHKGIG